MFLKKMKKSCLWLLAAGIITLFFTGFCIPAKPKKQPFVVERQECVFQFMVGFIPSHDIDIGFTVDVPVGGGKTVVDSVMRFINEAVYGFMESGDGSDFTPEQVYCADGKQFAKHYYDAYKPLVSDTCYEMEEGPGRFCDPEYFSVIMVGQTDAFVTYQIGTLYLGEGALFFCEWFSFSKDDGHRLQNLITTENLLRFFEEHPEEENDISDEMKALIYNGYSIEGGSTFGLTGDKLLHQFRIPGDIYDAEYNLEVIKPYLTDEAKKLFEKSNL